MACGSCGNSSGSYNGGYAKRSNTSNNIHEQIVIEDCEYTTEQMEVWLSKVKCFKDKGLYVTMPNITVPKLNSYIGTLLSTRSYPTNICYFKDLLDEIAPFITVIISTEQC